MPTHEPAFPKRVAKPDKRTAGHSPAALTPITVRARRVALNAATRAHVDERMRRQFAKFALHIERAVVLFSDVNGPRGGVDQLCSVELALSGRPSVRAEERAATARAAFDRAAAAARRSLLRLLSRSGFSAPGPKGQGGGAATAVAALPAKAPTSTADRNYKRNTAGLTAALEDSATGTPSRKSTRGSANRAKRDTNLRQRQTRRVTSSKARARRAAVKRKRA